jgi:hypothetical protein
MIRSRKFRVAAGSVLAGGVLGATMLGAFAGVAGASGGPTQTLKPDIVGNSQASVTATGAPTALTLRHLELNPVYAANASGNIFVAVECNANVLGSDPLACNENGGVPNPVGGPWIVSTHKHAGVITGRLGTHSNPMAVIGGTDFATDTNVPIGDGSIPAGSLGYILLELVNPATDAPVAEVGLIPFGVNPAA